MQPTFEPRCGRCGIVMTPETAKLRPELFLHDACLPPDIHAASLKELAMRKHEELNHPKSCLNKARLDERLFVLLERDLTMPDTIRFWARKRIESGLNDSGDAQIVEALKLADDIERERTVMPPEKTT